MPTTAEYLELVTSFHRGKPKFTANVEALTGPLADIQSFMRALISDFDLDAAVGSQLDIVGEWIGRSRYVETPIANVYFSFDDAPRGFDKGVWKGPYDSVSGLARLDDDTYRLLLRAKISANNWNGTVEAAKSALDLIFTDPATKLFVQDNYDMSMAFGMAGTLPSILVLALFAGGYLPLKPEGVRATYLITSVNGGPLFGFDMNNDLIAGFDAGAWGVSPNYALNHLI